MSYTTKQRNEIYKKLKKISDTKGCILYSDYCEATKDFGYSFRFHSSLPELALFEPCRITYIAEIEKVQPIALEFCIAMTENQTT